MTRVDMKHLLGARGPRLEVMSRRAGGGLLTGNSLVKCLDLLRPDRLGVPLRRCLSHRSGFKVVFFISRGVALVDAGVRVGS